MIEALVIRLHRDSEVVQHLLVDAVGGRLGAVVTGPLSQAAPLSTNRRVIVIVPGVDVVLAMPELPAKNVSRLAQLAPYALEEQLATDIESMHFAIGKRTADGKTPVAAIGRELIERSLTQLRAAGIEPNEMYAETSLLPGTANGVTAVLDEQLLYIRKSETDAFALDARPLVESTRLALDSGEENFVGEVTFYVSQTDYEIEQRNLDALREHIPSLQIKLLPEGPLPLFARQINDASPVNLLSGPYERKSSLAMSLAPWRVAAALLVAAIALQLTYGGVRLWQAARTEKKVDTQIRELVTQTMPSLSGVNTNDVRRQLEARISAAHRGGTRGELLTSLSALGEALNAAPGTRLEALSYRTQVMDLRITAPNVDSLDKIQQAATAGGLTTQIQSATPRDNKVEGRLQLKL